MFILFTYLCTSYYESGYSLYPPYYLSDVREISNWTLVGAAVNLKKTIRLTSNLKNQYGGLCSRIPTQFRDWTAVIDVSCYNGKKWGNGFTIYFTRNVCPDETFQYDGYSLSFSTNESNPDGESPIFFEDLSKISTKKLQPVGYASIRANTKNNLKINLRKTGNKILLETTQGQVFQRLFEKEFENFPEFGYFSISASTGDSNDIHELNSFTLYQMSEVDQNHRIENIESVNHEIIEKSKATRRKMKRERRTKMPEITKYLEMVNQSSKLSGKQFDFNDALKLVYEMKTRADETITNNEFQEFFYQNLKNILDIVHRKINSEAENFEDVSNDISKLWIMLQSKLKNVEFLLTKEMDDFKKEMLSKVLLANIEKIQPDVLNGFVKTQKHEGKTNLPIILLTICVVELIVYIIFFIYKRTQTNGFKKID